MILEEVFRHTPVGVALVDLHGTIFDANPALGKILGCEPAKIVGRNFRELIEENTEEFDQLLASLRDGLRDVSGRMIHVRDCNQRSLSVNVNLSVVESTDEEPAWCVAFVEDVEQRVRMESRLRDSEDRYRRIVEDQIDLISRSRPDGTLLFVNDAYCRHFKVRRENVIGRSFFDFIDKADWPEVRRKLAQLTPERPVAQNDHRVLEADGSYGWQRWIDRGFFDENGRLVELQSVGHDVTEEREAVLRLRQSEERFRGLFRNLPIAVWESDWTDVVRGIRERGIDSADKVPSRASETVNIFKDIGSRLRVHTANTVALELAEVDTLEEFERWVSQAGTPDSMRRFIFAAKSLLFEGARFITVPVTLVSTKGTETEGIMRTSRIGDSPDDWRMIVVMQDLSEYARIGRELRERQELMGRVEAAAHVGSWEWDPRTNLLRGSAEFWKILTGVDTGETERPLKESIALVHPDDLPELREMVQGALAPSTARPDSLRKEFRLVRESGATIIARANIFYWYGERGVVERAFGTLQNVTELKRAENEAERHREEMIRADKMISLGILVSGVAHEINNPNHSIMLNLPILRDAWRDVTAHLDRIAEDDPQLRIAGTRWGVIRDEVPDVFSDIEQASERIRTIVAELKGFAVDREKGVRRPTSVNAIVQSALRLLANIIRKSTTDLRVELSDDLPMVNVAAQRIEQVLVNLVVNACQALESDQKAVTIRTSATDREVLVSVSDEGSGIAADDIRKITDPFFTTKRNTGGTGLGLAVSQRIVEDHGGRLTFESEVGRGTTATLSIPIKNSEVSNV